MSKPEGGACISQRACLAWRHFYFLEMCMGVPPACISVCSAHAWCLGRPEEGIWFPGTGVNDGCSCHACARNRTWVLSKAGTFKHQVASPVPDLGTFLNETFKTLETQTSSCLGSPEGPGTEPQVWSFWPTRKQNVSCKGGGSKLTRASYQLEFGSSLDLH